MQVRAEDGWAYSNSHGTHGPNTLPQAPRRGTGQPPKRPEAPPGTSPPTAQGFPWNTRRWKGRGRSGGKAPSPPPGVSPPALGPAAAAPLGKSRWRLGGAGQGGPRGQTREAPTHVPPSPPPPAIRPTPAERGPPPRRGRRRRRGGPGSRARVSPARGVDPGPAPLSPYALGAGSGWKAKCAADRREAWGSGGRRLQSPPRRSTAAAAAPEASAPRSANASPAAAIAAAIRGRRGHRAF